MTRYSSEQETRFSNSTISIICGISIFPLSAETKAPGPAAILNNKFTDIVSEALFKYRVLAYYKSPLCSSSTANLHLNYLVWWIGAFISHLVSSSDNALVVASDTGLSEEITTIVCEQPLPDFLLVHSARSKREMRTLLEYLLQLRMETARRLIHLVCTEQGVLSKWWTQYSGLPQWT